MVREPFLEEVEQRSARRRIARLTPEAAGVDPPAILVLIIGLCGVFLAAILAT